LTHGLERAPIAADKAAEKVGMSRNTAEKAVEVVKVIDEAESKGDTETASHLRETLNTKSVSAAKREADKVKPPRATKPKKQAKAGKEKSVAKLVDGLSRHHVSPLVRGIDAVADANGGKGDHHAVASASLDTLIAELRNMREGKR
jgi:hypothetical protein